MVPVLGREVEEGKQSLPPEPPSIRIGVPSRNASKMGPDDLRQHVVADLRGFADFAGNGGAVAAGLFRMNVDEGERLLSRILRPGARG
jgi:hypothetical protein